MFLALLSTQSNTSVMGAAILQRSFFSNLPPCKDHGLILCMVNLIQMEKQTFH